MTKADREPVMLHFVALQFTLSTSNTVDGEAHSTIQYCSTSSIKVTPALEGRSSTHLMFKKMEIEFICIRTERQISIQSTQYRLPRTDHTDGHRLHYVGVEVFRVQDGHK